MKYKELQKKSWFRALKVFNGLVILALLLGTVVFAYYEYESAVSKAEDQTSKTYTIICDNGEAYEIEESNISTYVTFYDTLNSRGETEAKFTCQYGPIQEDDEDWIVYRLASEIEVTNYEFVVEKGEKPELDLEDFWNMIFWGLVITGFYYFITRAITLYILTGDPNPEK